MFTSMFEYPRVETVVILTVPLRYETSSNTAIRAWEAAFLPRAAPLMGGFVEILLRLRHICVDVLQAVKQWYWTAANL